MWRGGLASFGASEQIRSPRPGNPGRFHPVRRSQTAVEAILQTAWSGARMIWERLNAWKSSLRRVSVSAGLTSTWLRSFSALHLAPATPDSFRLPAKVPYCLTNIMQRNPAARNLRIR